MSASAGILRRPSTRVRLTTLLTAVLAMSLAGLVEAGTYTVTNTADDGPGSLRRMITLSNTHIGMDRIEFDTLLHGQTILLTSGQLTITDKLVIDGPGEDLLTVTRDPAAPDFRIFEIDDGDGENHINVVISGLTISGGRVYSGEPDAKVVGGGVLSWERLTLRNSTVTGNRLEKRVYDWYSGASVSGGGIESSYWLAMYNVTVSANTIYALAIGYYCGGGAAGGGVKAEGYLLAKGCAVTDNTASVLVDDGSWINEGRASGGGVWCETAVVRDSTISGNVARGNGPSSTGSGNGGGIYNTGPLTIENTTVSGNLADGLSWYQGRGHGGGIRSRSSLMLRNSTVSGNSVDGSAAYVITYGGGIDASTAPVIQNSTIAFNSANGDLSYGGGLDAPTGGTLESTIICSNTADDGTDVKSPGFNVVVDNLIGDPTGSNIPIGSYGNITGDPQLGPLQANGGPTETHAIDFDSIAVDTGANPACLNIDQRGYWPRDFGGVTDIGAYEYGAIPPLLFSDDFESGTTSAWSMTVP